MARLLITGASGLLGANLVLEAAPTHTVIAAAQRHRLAAPGIEAVTVDLTAPRAAADLIADARPEWVIHCAAATDVDRCETEPAWADSLNHRLAGQVAAAAQRAGAGMIQISTDAVFDGARGDYLEDDRPAPTSVYGATKLAGEDAVRAAHPRAVIVRTNIYGWNARPKRSLAEWFLDRCQRGIPSPGWTDVASTPILVNDLAERLLAMMTPEAHGLYHVGGATCLTKHDFGRRVAQAFGFDPQLIRSASVGEAGLPAHRGRNVCLSSRRLESELGLTRPTVDEGLERFHRMARDGSVDRLRRLLADPHAAPAAPGREELRR